MSSESVCAYCAYCAYCAFWVCAADVSCLLHNLTGIFLGCCMLSLHAVRLFTLFAIFSRVMALQLWLECLGWWPVPSPSHPAKRLVGALWDSFIDAKVCPRVSHNFDMLETHLNFAQFCCECVLAQSYSDFLHRDLLGLGGATCSSRHPLPWRHPRVQIFRVFRVFQSIST